MVFLIRLSSGILLIIYYNDLFIIVYDLILYLIININNKNFNILIYEKVKNDMYNE